MTGAAMQQDVILTIDNGTQSVRALLFDVNGNLLAKSQHMITPYHAQHPGWAENDPEYYWESVAAACQKLWANTDIPKSAIRGVGLTTQRATTINLDVDGKPLRPAIVWMDQRKAQVDKARINPFIRGMLKLLRVDDTFWHLIAEAKSNWIEQNQPEVAKRTHKHLFLSGFLTHKLCGEYVDSVACQVGYVPFDYKNMRWAGKYDLKWKGLDIKREWLPDLVPAGQVLGRISRSAAEATGIPEGLPLIACAADKACEVLGSGGISPNIACLSFGTTATINIASKKYFERIPFIPPFPAAMPGIYNSEVQIFRGYWMVSWFKEQFGFKEQVQAEEDGCAPEELFDELIKDVPAGSMGLMLQPYWNPGVRDPGPEAKGAIIGFGDAHTRGHVYRAILEGLAYGLRDGREQLEKARKVKIDTLRVSGGGSQSDAAMQLTADIFNLPACRPHTFETSGLGAAINVAVGLGLHPDFDTAVAAMTRVGDVFEPQPQAAKLYDELYNEVYQKMYKQLQPLYKKIRDITGYPAS